MAASTRRNRVDYRQLNSFSSAVLYNTTPKRRNSKFHSVERIIERRKRPHGYEYLIKWKGWPFHSCSWEPSDNLNQALLRSYGKPERPDGPRLESSCRDFVHAIQSSLKSKSNGSVYANMDLDVWRYVTFGKGRPAEHKGHTMFEKEDFCRFDGLPDNWFYTLNELGEGISVKFPIKAKPIVSWSSSKYLSKNRKLEVAPKMPLEKISILFVKRACNIDNV